jgi:hypothetical protein
MYGEHLFALVRDPNSGLILKLDPQGWQPLPRPPLYFHKRSEYEPITCGLDFDYVTDPYDELFSGPEGTLIDGSYRPVFFWRKAFDQWFKRAFAGVSSKRVGRKPGSGSFETDDQPFLQEMDRLIKDGIAASVEDAANRVAERARGASKASTRTRLAKRYRKQHLSEGN